MQQHSQQFRQLGGGEPVADVGPDAQSVQVAPLSPASSPASRYTTLDSMAAAIRAGVNDGF